ncbi:MAG TPA: RNA methyltransferase [Caulobacteraceae bacterium]|nr:RNA methyltransferase [Caulobacteraceae bacterium]
MTRVVAIEDADDPRIALFREVRERDVIGRRGGFIAEGEVVLRVLARSRLHRPRSVLVAAKRVTSLSPILSAFSKDVDIFAAGQEVMDAIAGFPIHRGILAFAERGPPASAGDLLAGIEGPAIVVALFGVSNHDNIGGVFRNAAAFGAAAVLLDGACCDPLYRKAIRVSVGGSLVVPFARLRPEEDALELVERHGFSVLALSPGGAKPLAELAVPPRAAILLGSEGAGLSPALLARARTIAIPMADRFDSLNLATTSGIVLNHLADYGRATGQRRDRR